MNIYGIVILLVVVHLGSNTVGAIFTNDKKTAITGNGSLKPSPKPCASCSKELLVQLYNPKTRIHAVENPTSNTVPILDTFNNISVLKDGAGKAYLFNFVTDKTVSVSAGECDVWDKSKKSLREYFNGLPSLVELYRCAQIHGTHFEPNAIPDDIAQGIADILGALTPKYASKCEGRGTFMHVCKLTADYLKSSLQAFADVMGEVDTEFRGDFDWLVWIYRGMGATFEKIPGGIDALAKKDIKLDMTKILIQQSGIHLLIYFLENLHGHFDVCEILGHALDSQKVFFSLIHQLGGEGNDFDRYGHVLAEMQSFLCEESSLRDVEAAINSFASHLGTDGSTVKDEWLDSTTYLSQTLQRLGLDGCLKNLTQLLDDISCNRWMIGKVNMTKISTILMDMDSSCDKEKTKEILTELQHK